MAGGSDGCRAALILRHLTPGLISSSPGTAGLPPFIAFSTSYPELDFVIVGCSGGEARGRRGLGTLRSISCCPRLLCRARP